MSRLLIVVGHVFLLYAFLLLLLRLMGRRSLSQLRPIDILTMLLLSETVSPALTSGDQSLAAALTAAAALAVAATLTSWLSFRFPKFDDLLDGTALLLIDEGEVDSQIMRRERITNEELRSALHEHGLLDLSQVRKAFLAPDGTITIVKAAEP